MRKLLLAIVFSIVLGVAAFGLRVNANSAITANDTKTYESYFILKGDTLWSIAEAHVDGGHYTSAKAYIKEVKEINGLSTDHIQSGNYLLLPSYITQE